MSARPAYQGPPRFFTRPLPGTFHRIYSVIDEYGYVIAEQISCPEGIEVPMPPGTRPLRWTARSDAMRQATGTPADPKLLLYRNKARTCLRAPKSQQVSP